MCTPTSIITDIFSPFQDYVNSEQATRDQIRKITKDIEKPLREIITILQVIHHARDIEQTHMACLEARKTFNEVREGFDLLDKAVPPGQYYRYNDNWRFATQRLCFLASLIVFLEKGILINKETAAQILGVDNKSNIHLDLEDYLMGLLNLASELSRYAINSVTLGDYDRPLQISNFVAQLNAGFRLLNLKNDSLRKKFDALKYDVKKIEEVVYDLSIRGFGKSTSTCDTSTTCAETSTTCDETSTS